MVTSVGVVGGGLCGLATSFYLMTLRPGLRVTVYDPACVYGVARDRDGYFATASALAAGLLHPLTPKLKLAWEADAAMAATLELMGLVGGDVILRDKRIVRPCRDAADAELALKASSALGPNHLEWLSPESLSRLLPNNAGLGLPGVAFSSGRVVDAPAYMAKLGSKLKELGVDWVEATVEPSELAHDVVVCCGGAAAATIFDRELGKGFSVVRSHSLRVVAPDGPDVALLRGDYVCPTAEQNTWIVGATRDRLAIGAKVDSPPDSIESVARRLEAAAQLAGLDWAPEPITIAAGARFDGRRTQYGRLPFVLLRGNVVLAGGLGARGLLRHAQIGKLAALTAITGNDAHLPPQLKPL